MTSKRLCRRPEGCRPARRPLSSPLSRSPRSAARSPRRTRTRTRQRRSCRRSCSGSCRMGGGCCGNGWRAEARTRTGSCGLSAVSGSNLLPFPLLEDVRAVGWVRALCVGQLLCVRCRVSLRARRVGRTRTEELACLSTARQLTRNAIQSAIWPTSSDLRPSSASSVRHSFIAPRASSQLISALATEPIESELKNQVEYDMDEQGAHPDLHCQISHASSSRSSRIQMTSGWSTSTSTVAPHRWTLALLSSSRSSWIASRRSGSTLFVSPLLSFLPRFEADLERRRR